MNKKLLCMFLVLAMLASMIVVPASAAKEENLTPSGETCPCGCGQILESVTWTPWDSNHNTITSGHYFLDGDYVQTTQQEIMAGDRVVLDLRGNTITSKEYGRLLLVYGRMHVLDTAGGGRFMSKTSGGAFGGVVMVSTNEVNDSLFELCSGTITRDADNKGSRRGGLIHLSETATFRMTGGVLLNGSTISTSNPDKKEPGGCVAGNSANSTIEILGGQIIGGESATHGGNIYSVGTTVLKNCRIIGGVSATSGGNVCQNGGSLTIENCIIESGVSNDTGNGGGNISVMSNAALTMKDSTVRNGWTSRHGGNLYMGSATATIENTQISAGVAQNRGNNIYGSSSADGLVIRNCDFPGDVTYIGSGLKLEGLVKIGLLNNGLRLWYSSDHAVVDATALTEGSQIYVSADHTFTGAGADLSYFKGALRTVITESAEGLVGTQAADGEVGGYCPHCNKKVAWHAFDLETGHVQNCLLDSATDENPECTGNHVASGHYYLTQSLSSVAQQYIGSFVKDLGGTLAVEDVVLDLAGYSISATGRSFYLRPADAAGNKNQLTILDSFGAGKITGSGANTQGGGVLYNENSILNIYGGSYVYNPVSGRNITGGGVITSGDFTMHGGTLDGSAFAFTDASTADKTYNYYGGVLQTTPNRTVTITAGRMIGGAAQTGGVIYTGYNNTVRITGGQFSGGVAEKTSGGGGGCIRSFGDSSHKNNVYQVENASIRDGSVTGSSAGGGNLSVSYGTFDFTNCYIAGGSVVGYGGNITCGSESNITFTDCIIEGGFSSAQSGNVHVSATSATTNWVDCLVMNGTATTQGGNMYFGNGYNTVRGGQFLYGTATTTYGGNIAANAGNHTETSKNYTKLLANEEGEAPFLSGGNAKTYGGNMYIGGVADVQAVKMGTGKAGTLGQDLYVAKGSKQSKLTLGDGVVGDISVGFAAELLGSEIYGQPIDRTECTQLNASLILEGNYNDAVLCANGGALFVGAIAVIHGDGSYSWYTDAASAIADCDADSYVKLYIAQDVVLTKDCAVDICGQTVQFSGEYTLYGMDSSGDDFTNPTGRALVAQETKVATETLASGKQYVASTDETGYSFHRLENRITNVTLRTSADGIYYTGSFGGDETVAANVESYGIAVSLTDMPGTDFAQDEDTLYTRFDADTLVNGAQKTGVLISGILKEGRTPQENKESGEKLIFATSYLVLKDGTVLLGDDASTMADDLTYSLRTVMEAIDQKVAKDPLNYRKYTNTLRNYFDSWKDKGIGDWQFDKIETPEDDGVLDVLMIGSSFCYYYVEELAGLAAAAGIPMRVCNVYYSGCPLEKHYNWWINGEANYQFFDTTVENGRKQTNKVSLEWCLAQGEWDVISLQQSTSATINDPNHLETTRIYYTTLINYLTEQFPDATMVWHQPWTYQIGYDRNGVRITTPQQQQERADKIEAYCVAICEEFGIQRINTGEAWQIIRNDYGYDNLCARLGKGDNHEGDYYHDGDIGGGQYLNACVWFEIITGISCVGNTYAPTYQYGGTTYYLDSNITFAELQQAAHQAVLNLRAVEAAAQQ